MRFLPRLTAAPARVVRALVPLAGLACFGGGLVAYAAGNAPAAENLPLVAAALVSVAALGRRFGIALPGNGFSSYVVGVMLYAILDRGWAFAAVIAPFAMLVGDLVLRRVSLRSALGNAAHLTTGSTLVGLLYAQLGGQTDTAAQPGTPFRFDADAGLTGEAVRLRRAIVARSLARDQVVVPGRETPGSEMLVPLYHAGQLVGLWSVRHS